jgi:tetratricopeptide (TPR) repeat protein
MSARSSSDDSRLRGNCTVSNIPYQQAIDNGRALLRKALAINVTLAEAHSALSSVEGMEDNDTAAENEARRAIEINPNLADAYSNLAGIMLAKGDLDEAVRLREKAYQLDPLEPWNMTSLGDEYFWAGRESEALEVWETALKLAPYMTYDSMMDYYIYKGDYAKAVDTIKNLRKLDPDNPENDFWEGYLAATEGRREDALRVIMSLRKSSDEGFVTNNASGLIYCALGDLDNFFKAMQRAIETHTISVSVLRYSPLVAKARADPRFREIVKKYER